MADDPPAAKYLAVEEAGVSQLGSVYWLDRFPDKWSELERFYKAGVIPALYDALCLAKRIGISAPDWALKGAIEVIGDRISEGFSIGKGATGNESSKYRKSMQHYRRWQLVDHLRENKKLSLNAACEEAEKLLPNPYGNVGPETIKKSYKRVRQDLQDPEKALQYYRARDAEELTGTPPLPLG